MAKFGTTNPDDDPLPPAERYTPKTEAVVASIPAAPIAPPSPSVTTTTTFTPSPTAASQIAPQAQAITAQAQADQDQKILDTQLAKQDEHWMKSYWRPAMGWLYMLICLVDFVVFPVIAMFMPVILKGVGIQMNYVAWQSLTLSNGGLIHLAFGAILGITSYTRGQEKIAGK
jgi:hypothetical protein